MTEQTTTDSLIGSRLSRARLAKGYTPEQLAMRIGVKPSTINNWESERSYPRANRLAQLAGVLNVPLAWLLAGAESPPSIEDPNLDETAGIEQKLQHAESLLLELGKLLVEIRRDTRRVQREIDEEIA